MNIVQTLRRLGQQMNGWGNALDMQSAQMPLIKKLYVIVNFKIENTWDFICTCPTRTELQKERFQMKL